MITNENKWVDVVNALSQGSDLSDVFDKVRMVNGCEYYRQLTMGKLLVEDSEISWLTRAVLPIWRRVAPFPSLKHIEPSVAINELVAMIQSKATNLDGQFVYAVESVPTDSEDPESDMMAIFADHFVQLHSLDGRRSIN